MHSINKKSGYLLVAFEGEITYQEIKNAVEDELSRDDYQGMNDIWDFSKCTLLIKHDQLERVVNDVMVRYPKTSSRVKTAIVISSGFTKAMADFWVEQAYLLPYSVQVFMNLQDAEEWLA